MNYKILVINTGSTSTKVSLFQGTDEIYKCEMTHELKELQQCSTLADQLPYRGKAIEEQFQQDGVDLDGLAAVAARGGTFGTARGGAYLVEEHMLKACRHPITDHASNLSALIAHEIAGKNGCKAYIYDSVCTNEVEDIARITGLHDVKRRPFSHVLNTRAVARRQAECMGKAYEELNFVVAHLGGGISINVHKHGRIVDLVCDDEGPMSPERAGRLNGKALIDLCFSGNYDKKAIMKRIKGHGGLIDLLGTSDLQLIETKIQEGDEYAAQVIQAMAYQIAKDIAALSSVVCGRVDGIILTGGCAYSRLLTDSIIQRISYIAPVSIYPGAMEMEALARGITRVLDGEETYHIKDVRE